MYKLIFADDERLVHNSISKSVDLESVGFSLVGCCKNGYDLLELIEQEPPDLVILDINMPFISGIEAAEQIQSSYPHIKIVFLTGYTEFEYAKKAISLGAINYIVKPVSPDELISVLNEVHKILDEENERIIKIAKLEYCYKKNQEVLLKDLINDATINETIYERVRAQGFSWTQKTIFQIAVLSIDKIISYTDWKKEDQNVMLHSLRNITAELAEKNQLGFAYIVDSLVILFGYEKDKIKLEIGMQECIAKVLYITSNMLKFKIQAGLGEVCIGCENIHNSFVQANSALELGIREGGNKLYTKEDLENNHTCHTVVWHAINYIQENYSEPTLSVETLTSKLHISSSYLRTLFKRQTGSTIVGYITKIRMEQSLSLLNNTKLKNSEIAERVGYVDVHYFSYCFKRYFGVNTAEIRKNKEKK